jgi:hypothetical protein
MLKQSITPPAPIFIKDLGMRFPTEISKHKVRYSLYKCHCSNEFIAQTFHIKNGNTKSCGCLRKELLTKHGMRNHKLYGVIYGMIKRCTNPNNKDFPLYGGRGIKVCEEWTNDRVSFFNWALANGYEAGLTIDRIDNNRGYEPSNCRWVTMKVQNRNKRVIQSNNNSGYRGVYWYRKNNKWRANISIDGKHIHLGSFDTAIDAAKAYDKYVISHNLEHTINNV